MSLVHRVLARSSVLRAAPRHVRSFSLAPIKSREELEHATGVQRAELEAELEGKTLFDRSGLTGPFGTREKPVIVPSAYSMRPVACTGGAGHDEHELLWFNLFEGKKHICPECGQFFELKRVE